MIDKTTFDIVVKQLILKNFDMFSTRMLFLALYSCLRTSYQCKSIKRLYEVIL